MWSSLSWRVAVFARKRGEEVNRNVLCKVPLACDVRWTEVVARVAWMCAREVKRGILMNVTLLCGLRWVDRVGMLALKWAKDVNNSVLYRVSLRCGLRWAHGGGTLRGGLESMWRWMSFVCLWERWWQFGRTRLIVARSFLNYNKIWKKRKMILYDCLLVLWRVSVGLVGSSARTKLRRGGLEGRFMVWEFWL